MTLAATEVSTELTEPITESKVSQSPLLPETTLTLASNFASETANHTVVQGLLDGEEARMMVDSGATANFVDEAWVESKGLSCVPISNIVQSLSGQPLQEGSMTKECTISVEYSNIPKHEVKAITTKTQPYDFIIGQPELRKFDPIVDWKQNKIYLQDHTEFASYTPKMTHRYQPIHNARKALLDNISAIQQAHDDSILRTKNAFRLKDALSAQKFGLLAGCFQQDLFDEELQNASKEIQKML